MIYNNFKRSLSLLVSSGIFVSAIGFTLLHPSPLSSANLTSVKDTLQSGRLSVAARVKAPPTVAGGATVTIYTSASAPANTISTANLKAGDVLTIGANLYTIVGIVDASSFTVKYNSDPTQGLQAGDADDGDAIYLTMKPQHVITFTTATAVPNGFFQILLPADTTTPNDGKPDDQGWDFNTSAAVAAADVTGYDFTAAGVATAAGGSGCTAPANYHCFEVHYSGNGASSTAVTITIGNTNGTSTPIAPATGTTHTEATADSYPFIVKNFAAGANPNTAAAVDSTTGRNALIEAVRVTAQVSPTISFAISGVASGANPCGTGVPNQTDVDTTTGTNAPLAVPFGSLTLNTFYDAAHTLTVSTNAASGYTVTAQENDQLGKGGATTPFIPDTSGDGGSVTETVSGNWDTATAHPGFGFTEKAGTGSPTVAVSSTGANFVALRFPAVADPDTPLVTSVMSNTSVANGQTASMCYRITVDATQAAGDYENQITYTATGNF